MIRAAAIDVGTNSIKMVIGERGGDGRVHYIADAILATRLGEGVDSNGILGDAAIERSINAISRHIDNARRMNVDRVRIVSTSAVRDAANRDEFANRVREAVGIDLEILSEEDEACLSYSVVALDPDLGNGLDELVVIDIGGGSSEFAFGVGDKVTHCASVPIGAVRLKERILRSDPHTDCEISEAAAVCEEAIRAAIGDRKSAHVFGIGGAIVSLARIVNKIPPAKTPSVHGTKLTTDKVKSLCKSVCKLTHTQRLHLPEIEPKRADILPAGAIILDTALTLLGASELTVSIRGLRYGALQKVLNFEL